jgi:hypothetical protein
MTCIGHYEIKTLVYNKFIERIRCMHTNNLLENEPMYLHYAFQFDEINAFTIYEINKS